MAISTRMTLTGSRTILFDHLVGNREQRRRHVEAERLGDLEVQHELEFGGHAGLAKSVSETGAIASSGRQPPGIRGQCKSWASCGDPPALRADHAEPRRKGSPTTASAPTPCSASVANAASSPIMASVMRQKGRL
jgi:hypothetical protein